MHILIDVVSQYFRNTREPSAETTLYWGLNIAYGMGQIIFGAFALLVARYAFEILKKLPTIALNYLAAGAWLVFGHFFIQYRQPQNMVFIFIALHTTATISAKYVHR